MFERSVIHILAHIEFVEADSAVMGERNILCVNEIAVHRCGPGILQFHMPEPGSCGFREDQVHSKYYFAPSTASYHSSRCELIGSGAARAEQGNRLRGLAHAAQIQICEAALDFASEKEIDHDIPIIHAPNGSVGIEFDAQARRTGGAKGKGGTFLNGHDSECYFFVGK